MVSLWYFNGIYMVFIWYLHRTSNGITPKFQPLNEVRT